MARNLQETTPRQEMADALKGWTMVLLTFVFVLFGAALIGWLKPRREEQ